MTLSGDELETYHNNGFVVVENLLSGDEVERLRRRLRGYTHGKRPAGELRIQVEPRVQRGELEVAEPGDGIRKVEGLVEGDDLFRGLGLHANIVGIVEQILGPDLKMFRNSLLLKPPEVGSQKGMHQDSPYWPIEPMDLCSCWFALDDATEENGCLGVIPRWHRKGPLPHVKVTDDYVVEGGHFDFADMVMAPVRAGGGVFFHSLLPHYTAANRSANWRRAIVLSYMSAKSSYTHDGEGPRYFPVKGQTYSGAVL